MKLNVILKSFVFLFIFAVVVCISWLTMYAKTVFINRADVEPYPFYNDELAKHHLIAHAGAAIDGNIYTNSREAVENSIKNGRRYIEIDLIKTSDGHLVAAHDWERVNKMIGRKSDAPLSLKEFKNVKLMGKYSTMDMNDIRELFEKYPNWIMLSDKIRDVSRLRKELPYTDRIIVQTFGLLDYFKALKEGFKYPTLRLKGGRRGVKGIYKLFIKWGNVKSVILGEKSFNKNKDYIGELHSKGVTVILYGNTSYEIVDNPDKIKANLYKYIDLVDSDKLTKL